MSKFFNGISSSQPVRVDVNSPGGLVDEGTAIRAMLLRHEGHVTVQNMGVMASAAQFLSTGADEIWVAEAAMTMIHRPWTLGIQMGDWEEIEKSARALVKFMKQATATYEKVLAKRMGIPQSRVAELLKGETWYTADEAVEARLADKVYPVAESPQPNDEPPREMALTEHAVVGRLPTAAELVEALRPALVTAQ